MLTDRKTFLRLIAAAASLPSVEIAASQQTAPQATNNQALPVRVLEDCAAALRCALYTVGDRLGLFALMAQSGPVTAADLAHRAGLNPRLLREWLNAMAAASYIDYSPEGKTYLLTKEQASVLAEEESSAMFLGGMFQLVEALVAAAPALTSAMRTGKPLVMSDYPPDLSNAMERNSAPLFKHELVQKWIPLMPQAQAALTRGGAAVDLACGTGLASITLAKAFPRSRFAGYDPYLPVIRTARERAEKAGVSDRVEFVPAGSSKLPRGQFDLVTIFMSVHHFNDPVTELRRCREALKPGGTCFIRDGGLSPNPENNRNTAGRVAYAFSTAYCLHDSMTNNGVAFGAELTDQRLGAIAGQSGFSKFRRIDSSGLATGLYELRA